MILYIKYMVSQRCKNLVQQQLESLNIPFISVELGMLQFYHPLNPQQFEQLEDMLLQNGFALVVNKKSRLVTRVKSLVQEMVYHSTVTLRLYLPGEFVFRVAGYYYPAVYYPA
jgi:hypothetical protein